MRIPSNTPQDCLSSAHPHRSHLLMTMQARGIPTNRHSAMPSMRPATSIATASYMISRRVIHCLNSIMSVGTKVRRCASLCQEPVKTQMQPQELQKRLSLQEQQRLQKQLLLLQKKT